MSRSSPRPAERPSPTALRLAVLAGALLVATLGPAPAAAQQSDDERARAHFLAGRSYMEQARYDDAAEQFQEAYRLSQRPEMLMNASTAYERALRFDEAITALERYLELQADTAERATLEERLARLRQLRDRAAAVTGTAPAPAEESTAQAPPETERAPVDAGETEHPPRADGAALGELGMIGAILGGTGAAALVVALATGIVAHDQYQSLEARCGPDGRACPPGSAGDIDSGSALALTSTVTTFTGLALVAAGAALLVVDLTMDGGGGEQQTRLRIGPGGLAVEGTF